MASPRDNTAFASKATSMSDSVFPLRVNRRSVADGRYLDGGDEVKVWPIGVRDDGEGRGKNGPSGEAMPQQRAEVG